MMAIARVFFMLLLSTSMSVAFTSIFTRFQGMGTIIEKPSILVRRSLNNFTLMMSPKEDGRSSSRKRRTVLSKKTAPPSIASDEKPSQASSPNGNVSLFQASVAGKEAAQDGLVDESDLMSEEVNVQIRPAESKLPPLSGTALAKNAEFMKKNPVERYLIEFLEPTPVGQEPKLVQAAKTVTWVCVLLLVLVEIFVSVKVGGMPFSSTPSAPPPPPPQP